MLITLLRVGKWDEKAVVRPVEFAVIVLLDGCNYSS
jgi:hypothetical protein